MTATTKPHWSNWAGNVHATPRRLEKPRSEAELVDVVRRAAAEGLRVRAIGGSHSFTPTAASNDVMVSLDDHAGLESMDKERGLFTVRAGTRLFDLNRILHAEGFAQENMGDINHQSIAGAISTGTHGTGAAFGGISTQVQALRLIDGQGEVRTIDASDPDALSAARVGLGALGLISAVTLKAIPAYNLRMDIAAASLDEMLALAPEYARRHRHFEFYWIPYTNRVQVKRTDVSTDPCTERGRLDYFNDVVIENGAVQLLCELGKALPQHNHHVCNVMSLGITPNSRIRPSWDVFGSTRNVRFTEMEYAVPQDATMSALRDLRAMLERLRLPVTMPVEVRFARADDIMLSTAYGRDVGYLAVHMFKDMDNRRYFREAEAIFRAYDGRPHWGKMHHLSADDFRGMYPRFEDFRAVRERFDPERRFGNAYLTQVLGD